MGLRSLVFLLFSFLVFTSNALAERHSAIRLPGESFTEALLRNYQPDFSDRFSSLLAIPNDVLSSASEWASIDYSSVPIYDSKEQMLEAFLRVRDERYLESPHDATFMRRISWQYPDDGCFARAALANRKIESWSYPAPAKVFIFGNLTVKTANSPYGSVSWWYHVAPIVYALDGYYVLDAALNPVAPTPLETWVLTQVADLTKAKISICESYAYEPSSDCKGLTVSDEAQAMIDQTDYLTSEWDRATELGRDPEVVLGNSPPW